MRISTITENKQALVEQRVRSHWALCESVTHDLTPEQRSVVENIVLAVVPIHQHIPLLEAELTANQIAQIFGNVEKAATDAGNNRTMLGKGKDAAAAVNQQLNKVGQWLQNTTPVKGFDQKFEKAKADLKAKLGGDDSKVVQFTQKLGQLAKDNPGKTAAILGLLTAAAGIAGGPVGGAIAGKLLRGGMELVKGEKISTAVGKGMKQAAAGAAIGAASDAIGDFFGGDEAGAAADAAQGAADAPSDLDIRKAQFDVRKAEMQFGVGSPEAEEAAARLRDMRQSASGADAAGLGDKVRSYKGYDPEEFADAGDGQGVRVRTFDTPDDAGTDAAGGPPVDDQTSASGKPAGFDKMSPDEQAGELLYVDANKWTPEDYETMKSTGNLTSDHLTDYYSANPEKLAKKLNGNLNRLDDFINSEVSDYDSLPSTDREQVSGYLEQMAKKGGAGWGGDNPGLGDSVIPTGKKLSEGQIYLLFNRLETVNNQWLAEGIVFESVFDAVRKQRIDELDFGKIKAAAGAAVGKGMQKLATAGKNLTTKVTVDKLQSAWKKAGSPTDSNAVADILAKAGVNAEVVGSVYKDMGIEAPTKAAAQEKSAEPETGAAGQDAAASAAPTVDAAQTSSKPVAGKVDIQALANEIQQAGPEVVAAVKQMLGGARPQGGGKVPGKLSQTPGAVAKRKKRAAAKQAAQPAPEQPAAAPAKPAIKKLKPKIKLKTQPAATA